MIKQVGGEHYEYGDPDNQHWDLMDRWDIEYLPATATKYIVRFDRKGTPKLDLEKSISYLEKQLQCHPNKGCRRLVPLSEMEIWYQSNEVSGAKMVLLELVLVEGAPRNLRQAIKILKEIISAEYNS